ncbi:hypothetical protein [Phenylobacterium sp.]|uniref:hypothetical protein n=1 Tax=Phenylobacterium sp. TaxID=1871053 RepID=UPI00301CF2D5
MHAARRRDAYAQQLGAPGRFDATQGVPTKGGGRLSPEACEFLFIGGAGVGGDYLKGFRRAFEAAGIQNVRVPGESHPARRVQLGSDVSWITRMNDLDFARSLVGMPQAQAAARRSRSLGDEQFNLGGYSYGAAAAAAQAYAVAEEGGKVDNLVLVGAPINADLYGAVRKHPNIRNVINVDLDQHGDPIRAGMTDDQIARAFPRIGVQFFDQRHPGHFYYSGVGPEHDRRRKGLADMLVERGVR